MSTKGKPRLTVRELVLLALIGALMFASKLVLSAIPNVHLGAVLILLAVLLFGKRAFYSIFVYVLLEGLVYGFGVWFISYLYAWPLLALAALPLRQSRNWLLFAILAGAHGLLFGAMCTIPYIFIQGLPGAITWWISGLLYDVLHCAANFTLTLILLKPLYTGLSRLLETRHG